MKKFSEFVTESADAAIEAGHKALKAAGWVNKAKEGERPHYKHPSGDKKSGLHDVYITHTGKRWATHTAAGQRGDSALKSSKDHAKVMKAAHEYIDSHPDEKA